MSTADTDLGTVETEDKPNEFAASGDSPPPAVMSSRLVEELAEIADLHRTYVGSVERDISIDNIEVLAKAVKKTCAELLKDGSARTTSTVDC